MKKILVLMIVFLFLASLGYAVRPDNAAIKVDSLKYEPYPVEAGQYFKAWIKVENYGNDEAEDAVFILEPKFPFSLDSNEDAERNIGQLDVAEEVVLEYLIRVDDNAVEGDNEIDFKFTTDGMAWVTHTFDIFVRTHDTMLNVQDVSVSPAEVAPGNEVTLSVKLKNMADSLIKDLRAELELTRRDILSASVEYSELPFTTVGSTNVLMTKNIGPLEQKIFNFKLLVDPDTEPKVYRIPLTLTYTDELGNTTYEEESVVAVTVTMEPDIMINLDNKGVYQANSKGEVSVGIYNTGVSAFKFATLELLESEDYEVLSSDLMYLGNIDSDDYETADFVVYVNKENPELLVKLSYKDEFNEEYTKQSKLLVETYSKEEAKKYGFVESNGGFAIFIILLIFVGGGWFLFKKFKKKKRH